jgi:co-chaperonin GroES (HSP10)
MSDNTFTQVITDSDTQMIGNQANTSVGVDVKDGVDYGVSSDKYNISKVLDDVILGRFMEPKSASGEKVSKGGIIFKDTDKEESNLYEVIEVLKVGINVKEIDAGMKVVVAKSAGMKVVAFDGLECTMVREANVFMVVEDK